METRFVMSEDSRKAEVLAKFGQDFGKMVHYYHVKCDLPLHEIIGMVHINLNSICNEIERECSEEDDPDFPWT